jgi:DNA polymerase III subunit epsilon
VIRYFSRPWHEAPLVVVDTETTGTRPAVDKVVQIGWSRFERGEPVDEFETLVDPGIPIPAEATAVHGITDEMVRSAPSLDMALAHFPLAKLQIAAYNAEFDRDMVYPIGADPRWPWLDPLVLIRFVDRYEKGKGRHTLSVSCARHGVELVGAHGALADARAAGKLLYKLGRKVWGDLSLGETLLWTWRQKATQWHDYHSWLAKQPAQEPAKEQSCPTT